MKALVIGGAGFIGSALCRKLSELGDEVSVLDPRQPDSAIEKVRFIRADGNPATLDRSLTDIDVCFHLASTTSPATADADVLHDVESNLGMSIRLYDAAVRAGVKRIVFLSSGGTVYGPNAAVPTPEDHVLRPISAYGATKVAIENYLRVFRANRGLDYRVARLSNPYGLGQSKGKFQGAIPIFMRRAQAREPIEIWGEGGVVRDFIYLDDAVDALILLATDQGTSHTFNVGSGEGTSINTVLEKIAAVAGRALDIRYLPARSFDVGRNILDCTLMATEHGWSARTSLDEGMRRTWEGLLAAG